MRCSRAPDEKMKKSQGRDSTFRVPVPPAPALRLRLTNGCPTGVSDNRRESFGSVARSADISSRVNIRCAPLTKYHDSISLIGRSLTASNTSLKCKHYRQMGCAK